MNDEGFATRDQIAAWMLEISGTAADGTRNWKKNNYGSAIVSKLDKKGVVNSVYKFYNMWPTELAEIPLAWDSDQIEEYTITWAYDYWTRGTAALTPANQVGTAAPALKI